MADIPVMAPRAPTVERVRERLRAIDESGWYSNLGPQERELRARFASRLHVDADQVATTSNATMGLAGAMFVLGGDRWSVPTFTFAATPAAVLAAGKDVVLADSDPFSWVLEPGPGEVDGFVPVAPFGAAPDIERWSAMGRVVHDAAASLGEEIDLSNLSGQQAVVFSLHATKVLGSGEGGIVVFADPAAASQFRAWTNFGFAESREATVPGVNAKMSEVQAAYAHAALDGWEAERNEWLEARALMTDLSERLAIELFSTSRTGVNPYNIALFPSEETTLRVERTLAEQGIETRRWWSAGCHRMPAYRHLAEAPFPVAERLASTSLGLPFFRGITAAQIRTIGQALDRALQDPQ